MFTPLSVFIGFRYTKAKRDNHFISFISMASVIGIALGVIVLITVLSVINGYETGIRDRYLGMLSHVTVTDSDWRLPNWQKRRNEVLKVDNVLAAAPFVEKQVMLKEADKVQATLIEAVIPSYEKDIGTINQFIKGSKGLEALMPGEFSIILGETLAKKLGVVIGDSVTLLSPKKSTLTVTSEGVRSSTDQTPILRDFTIVDTFKVDMQIYDSGTAYIHMQDAMALFDMNENATGLRIQINDI